MKLTLCIILMVFCYSFLMCFDFNVNIKHFEVSRT